MTLPFVLLLLDYWPFDRFRKNNVGRIIAEKIPFIILTVLSSFVTLAVQYSTGLVKSLSKYSFWWRIENAVYSYLIYIKKMFWPVDLAIFYPHPKGGIELWQITAAVLILGLLIFIALKKLRTRPYIAVGLFWFLGTLVPVIGIFQVGLQAYADRYSYIPYIGLFISITWWIYDLSSKMRRGKIVLCFIAGVILIALGLKTYVQTFFWKNSLTLYSHAINVTKDNWWAHNFMGKEFASREKYAEAIEHFKKSLDIYPDNAGVFYDLAKTYIITGDINEAAKMYEKLLVPLPGEINAPRRVDVSRADYPLIRNLYVNSNINFARILVEKGDLDQAERRFKEALVYAPDSKEAKEGLKKIKELRLKKTQKKEDGSK